MKQGDLIECIPGSGFSWWAGLHFLVLDCEGEWVKFMCPNPPHIIEARIHQFRIVQGSAQ